MSRVRETALPLLTSIPIGVILLTRRQPVNPAAASNEFCSICTLNGVYTEFGIDPQKSIQARDRTSITSLTQLHPKHHNPGVWVSSSHIQNQLDFISRVLVWMTMGTMRAVCKRLECAIIALPPAVNILPVQTVADGHCCDPVLVCIFYDYLPKSHCLCYLIHGE